MSAHPNGSYPDATPGSTIYVDTENLREPDHAQAVVSRVVANWPADLPPLGSLSLYVRADKAELWQLWAEAEFPALRVRVRGVQHFSNHWAKNSADLAITADAVADLVTGLAGAVAVVSNDSDFGALFVKVRELAAQTEAPDIPFLWITAPGAGALSAEIEQFIPDRYRWDLSAALASSPASVASRPAVGAPSPPKSLPGASRPALTAAAADNSVSDEAVAEELLRQLPTGRFRAAEAQQVVRNRWPNHPMASAGSPQFGQFLSKEIWPHLQKSGVNLVSPRSPRTYEIVETSINRAPKPEHGAANDLVGASGSRAASKNVSSSHLDYKQIAAAIAGGVSESEDVFAAAAAQTVIKNHWPDHPVAEQTQQAFGVWFKDHIWPILESNGVILASEKPRRYEMTPDARHNLIALT